MDQIKRMLEREIYLYKSESYDNFSLEVSVHPTHDKEPVYNLQGQKLGYSCYQFDAHYKVPEAFQARIYSEDDNFSENQVEILLNNEWCAPRTYLKSLCPKIDWNARGTQTWPEMRQRRSEQQQRWWLANGKTFPFLQLPSEIRDIVYRYAMGPRVEPYPSSRVRGLGRSNAMLVARMPNTSLLYVCRLVYNEASAILFKGTPFFIDQPGILSRLLSNGPESQGCTRIRQLELSLTHAQYFILFGIEDASMAYKHHRANADKLSCLQLDRLVSRCDLMKSSTSDDGSLSSIRGLKSV